MYACLCFGVNEKTTRAYIRDGAHTLEALAEISKAGSDCGGCKARLQRLIAEETGPSNESARKAL